MRFDDYHLSDSVKENIRTLGWKRPTDIQFKAIPSILDGEDVLAIAQTGTGKTAAFVVPLVHLIDVRKKTKTSDYISAVVMVPTRELAIQITDVFQKLSRHTKVKPLSVFGGIEQDNQVERLLKGVDVLVATPGRLFDLQHQGYIKLDRIKYLVLDEADHMLDLGFLKDIQDLQKHLPEKRQTLFFSATINKKIKTLAYSFVKNAIRIQISPKDPVARNVSHAVAYVEMDEKRFFLERFINEHPDAKILVFVRTKVRAERVVAALGRVNIVSAGMHGDKVQKDRLSVLKRFRDGEIKILVATDVSSRGIDIPDVDYVINYDLPEKAENYVHRVGRTGRGTKKGKAIAFCSAEEKTLLNEIEEFIGKDVEVLSVSKTDYKETIELSGEENHNWQKLIEQQEIFDQKKKKRNRK